MRCILARHAICNYPWKEDRMRRRRRKDRPGEHIMDEEDEKMEKGRKKLVVLCALLVALMVVSSQAAWAGGKVKLVNEGDKQAIMEIQSMIPLSPAPDIPVSYTLLPNSNREVYVNPPCIKAITVNNVRKFTWQSDLTPGCLNLYSMDLILTVKQDGSLDMK
jgi:hypothetical protein